MANTRDQRLHVRVPVLLGLFALGLGMLGGACADEGLREVTLRAIQDNPRVVEARAKRNVAQFELDSAEWARYPQPSASFQRDNDNNRIGTIALTQPLWAGGRIDGEIAVGEARYTAAVQGLREAELAAAEDVAGIQRPPPACILVAGAQ